MASSSQQTSTPSGDDRNLVHVDENYLAPGFEDRLQMFWERYSRTILIVVSIVLLAIVGRGVVVWMNERQLQALSAEYAALEGKDALLAFAKAHPHSQLAGLAQLRVADDLYAAGDYAGAGAAYRDASDVLSEPVLSGRALMGAAISVIQAGKSSEGQTVLRELADDVARPVAIRAEAAFHLAVLAREAGKTDEASRRVEQVTALGDTGLWGQRALALRAQLETAAAATPSASTSDEAAATVSFPSP